MKKLLIAILALAALLRITFLSSHIPALYGDEISIGYNAYSVLHTGKDEFGRFLPIQFESWGDQKNPVYIYLVAIFEIFLGLNAWSVRLPSALAGICAVWLTYLLVKELFKLTTEKKEEHKFAENTALLSAALLAINPWHVLISRGGYEANLALTLGLAGIYFFIRFLENKKFNQLLYVILVFTLAMYTYYTTKLFVPMLLLFLGVFGVYTYKNSDNARSLVINYLQKYIKALILFAIVCLPIGYLAFFSNGQARFVKINIFNSPNIADQINYDRSLSQAPKLISTVLFNKPTTWFGSFINYYADNLSWDYWYIHGDSSLRYSISSHGMFYLLEAPLFILGMLFMFTRNRRLFFFLIIWLLLAPIPTSLVGKSYGLRSIVELPVPLIFVAYGTLQTIQAIHKKFKLYPVAHILITLWILSAGLWLAKFSWVYPTFGYYWYDGMQKDAIDLAKENEDKYDHIIISKNYGKTEMYYAFYAQLDPSEYQKKSQEKVTVANTEMVQFGKYYFGDIKADGKSFNELNLPPNTLVIGSPNFAYGNETIKAKDDQRILFRILRESTDSER